MRRGVAVLFILMGLMNLASAEAFFDFTEGETPTPAVATSPMDEPTPLPSPEPTADPTFRMEIVVPKEKRGRILIYHTHTWEAYTQDKDAPYQETETWRTKDEHYNVVAVGEALAAQLTALGYEVEHDTTAFEPPNLDTAYARSLTMLERRSTAGESYDLYVDLHRDAVASTSNIRRTVNIGGEEVGRFMVLVGRGTTGGYAEKPDFEQNYALAREITACLNAQCDGLARDVKVRTGRFNQHVGLCVLIECGTNQNTLQEVLSGVPYLAEAIREALGDCMAQEESQE